MARPRLLLLLLASATFLLGTCVEEAKAWGTPAPPPAPSESECRPYIEKALKEMEHADAAGSSQEGADTGDQPGDDGKEDSSAEDTVTTAEGLEGESAEQAEDTQGEKSTTDDDSTEEAADEAEATAGGLEGEGDGTSSEQEGGSQENEENVTAEDSGSAEDATEEAAAASEGESVEEAEQAEDAVSAEEDKSGEATEQGESKDGESQENDTSKEAEEDASVEAAMSAESQEQLEGAPQSSEDTQSEEDKSGEEQADEATSGEDANEEATEEATSGEDATDEAKSGEDATDEAKSGEDATDEAKSGEDTTDEAKSGEDATDEAKSGEDATDEAKSGEDAADEAKSGEEAADEGTSVEDKSGEDRAEDGDKSGEDTSAEDKADEAKSGEDKSAEEKADEVKSDEDKSGEGKGDEDKSGEDKADEDKSGEDKADEDKSGEDKAESDEDKAKSGEEEGATSGEDQSGEDDADSKELPEEDLTMEIDIPDNLRPRDHIAHILKLDEESAETEIILEKAIDTTLRELKRLYDTAIKPLEMLYKYRDLSNRHFGDPEIFSKPLILFMGPWSGGKSTIVNYLLDNEYKQFSLRTGAEPSPAYFNILMHGERDEILDGTQLAADWTFSGLQKFGQGLLDRLRGVKLNNPLLEKVNIVEIPGILEIRKQVERMFPFNDACQWFIDRADIIFLVYDPSKLDVGPETEAILDQLKGREYQTRIILNKADQVKPEELMRVQGTLIWNISPLMSSAEPPIMYSTSLWSMPYEVGAPVRLLQAQEHAFLRDLREAVVKRVENKIASARRFAVRVRNHAKMVDCYLTTYYNHKTFFGNKKKTADDIIEHPQEYHIYEGLSTLTNISRYDLPDPETYRDFFKLNQLFEFQQLAATCTYFRGCPINRLDIAIAYDLPELVGKYKKSVEEAIEQHQKAQPKS